MRPIRIFDPNRFAPDPKKPAVEKKAATPLKRVALNKTKKPTGEKEVFEQIWKSRKHISFINSEKLGDEACSFMFMHVLSKAHNKFPLFKLYDKNIVLGTWEQHDLWDKGLRSDLKQLSEWNKMFELEADLKEEYKKLKA